MDDFGLVWCQPNGRPIDARADWRWKAVCREAGVRDARVHDGRHAAATMLLLQGADEQTVMAVMGWSDRRMLRRYQHVIDELRVEASKRVGALLWGDDEQPKPKKPKKSKGTKRAPNSGSGQPAMPFRRVLLPTLLPPRRSQDRPVQEIRLVQCQVASHLGWEATCGGADGGT